MSADAPLPGTQVSCWREYPANYAPKRVEEQIAILLERYPQLRGATADLLLAEQPLPEGAEAHFVIPRHEALAGSNNQATHQALSRLREASGLRDYRLPECALIPEKRTRRKNARTAEMFKMLGEQQAGHALLIVPAQFGFRTRGLCGIRHRHLMSVNEFDLDVYMAAIMLLTHPERFQHQDDLGVYCGGDEYYEKPDLPLELARVPCFRYWWALLDFADWWFATGSEYTGFATGFLP